MILIITKASLLIIVNFDLMKPEDPLGYFLTSYSFDKSLVDRWACGDKYLACLFTDGRLGVCALLGNKITAGDLRKPKTAMMFIFWGLHQFCMIICLNFRALKIFSVWCFTKARLKR